MTEPHFTLVSFHAHPDDEALLTGGTLSKAAAEGHRVVLVLATLGEEGLVDPHRFEKSSLAELRQAELQRSANRLGCARVVVLGYADSGSDRQHNDRTDRSDRSHQPPRERFAVADIDAAARRLADILIHEHADALTTYDASGGYGHPDHIQIHHVGARAAELAGTALVLEATIDRTKLTRAITWLRRCRRLTPGLELPDFSLCYTAPSKLTHRIDVSEHVDAKRDALRAHASQTTSTSGTRTLTLLLRLPRLLSTRVLGTEWFIERGRAPTTPLATDLFETLRSNSTANVD